MMSLTTFYFLFYNLIVVSQFLNSSSYPLSSQQVPPPSSLSKTKCTTPDNISREEVVSRRRSLLLNSGAATLLGTSILLTKVNNAYATTTTTDTTTEIVRNKNNLECLKDLPELPKDQIRLFLCRHGETEYNRLGLVQGSRIDAELNSVGELQAARLGQCLALSSSSAEQQLPPYLFLHSPLKRAKQTAYIAAEQYRLAANQYSYKPSEPICRMLPDVGEIDFGSRTDGEKLVGNNQLSMTSTYAAWARGDLDAKMSTDGESLRHALGRVSQSLYELQSMASQTASRSVVVTSHSSFLRLLLATCQQTNILDLRTSLKLANCCVNVVDLPLIPKVSSSAVKQPEDIIIKSSSPLLGGAAFSKAPSSYSLKIPKTNVVRINEQRHLIALENI